MEVDRLNSKLSMQYTTDSHEVACVTCQKAHGRSQFHVSMFLTKQYYLLNMNHGCKLPHDCLSYTIGTWSDTLILVWISSFSFYIPQNKYKNINIKYVQAEHNYLMWVQFIFVTTHSFSIFLDFMYKMSPRQILNEGYNEQFLLLVTCNMFWLHISHYQIPLLT